MLKAQLIPFKETGSPDICKLEKMNDEEIKQSFVVSQESRKRCPQDSSDDEHTVEEGTLSSNKGLNRENSSSYQLIKRQRRRTSSRERSRSISVTVTTFDCSSSGDETIYSAQGITK